ncbi:hypothetical protein JYU34_017922 [Plutella xylostella]|uniref:Transposase n=1 Tax=Plutella xylostella TaxID=51655 RepID=A0ABQ7PZB1_PLUXY|nr:hypothetical protein JYU34_017922 [Plutella xylostella]
MLQFREYKKDKMGRRFTKDEKVLALSLYKRGPRAYRLLRKIFVLPSPITLSRMVSRAGIKPGVNENIFVQLKKRARKMKPDDRLCTLIFDEMALSPHFDYSKKRDDIVGFVNNGHETRNQIADHALVFMIRGISKNYKQPICYTFCSGSTKKDDLAVLIKTLIRKLNSVGFNVLATVCDQGTSNVSAINSLIEQTKMEYVKKGEEMRNATFEIDGNEIIPLYDVPHLLKGIRNNLLTKELHFKIDGVEKVAKWDHITQLYKNNPTYKGIKIIKKLTENHCNPEKIPKMKVKFASQIFSNTVGLNMGYLADQGILTKECQDTADLLLFMDELFDSMNGSYRNSSKKSGKLLLLPLTPQSMHNQHWVKSKTVLKTMKFISKGKVSVVPSVSNWLRTIENMELLRNKLFKIYEIKSIWCRHFNQDPLENFFGSIRSHGYRNNNPTCAGFEAAYASLLINNLSSSYSPGSNCEDDSFKYKEKGPKNNCCPTVCNWLLPSAVT